jgi:uncharacterized protein involved in outer membrane biogenesis
MAEAASGALRLADGRLRLERVRARLMGGTLDGAFGIELAAGMPPRLALEARLADVALAAPLLGLPYDVAAGRGEAAARLTAVGHAPAALLGTLTGTLSWALRDGVLTGLDLGAAVAAASLPDATEAEARLRRALLGGATAFERLEAEAGLEAGQMRLVMGRLAAEGGVTATISGRADLERGALDLRIGTRPVPEAPELGLRITGPVGAPRALPEMSDWARWRAGRS